MTTPVACSEDDTSDDCVPFECNMCNEFPSIPECSNCQATTVASIATTPENDECDCSKPDCPPTCNCPEKPTCDCTLPDCDCEEPESEPSTASPEEENETTLRYSGPEVPPPEQPGTTAPDLGTAAPLPDR